MSSRHVVVALLSAALASCSNSDLEGRVKKLEESNAKYAEMLEMIHGQFAQQKKQQEEEEMNEAAPDARFAVDIKGNQIEGPASGAYVTIIEAWDFA